MKKAGRNLMMTVRRNIFYLDLRVFVSQLNRIFLNMFCLFYQFKMALRLVLLETIRHTVWIQMLFVPGISKFSYVKFASGDVGQATRLTIHTSNLRHLSLVFLSVCLPV
jgi:hypothetical protein